MKCEECLEIIEVFFDGELDARNSDEVSAHIAACASCTEVYKDLQAEQEFYSRAIDDVEVSPFFWTKVSENIKDEKAASPLRAFVSSLFSLQRLTATPVAAFCLLIVAIGISVVWFSDNTLTANVAKAVDVRLTKIEYSNGAIKNEDLEVATVSKNKKNLVKNKGKVFVKASNVVASNLRKKNVEDIPAADNIAIKAEQKYIEAIALLSRDINKRRSQIDPETVAQFKRTLAAVDQTIQSTRQAVRENPNDPVAVQYMLSAYSQKVDVLRGLVSY